MVWEMEKMVWKHMQILNDSFAKGFLDGQEAEHW